MTEWKPIPGYVGIYWICAEGIIRNAKGKNLTAINGKIELRKNGIRESFNVKMLTEKIFGEVKQ